MKTILVDAVETFLVKEEGIFTAMHELLEEYPNKKIVLTMAPPDLRKIYEMDNLPYEVWSSDLDPKKSDPKFYEDVLAHFNLKPENVVYFEHDPKAVESAASVGILTHYYDPRTRDLEALREFLDTNL